MKITRLELPLGERTLVLETGKLAKQAHGAVVASMGETMILAVAAGMQPNLTFNPLEPAATLTAFIVQVALGDLPHGSVGYQTIFAAGLTLMLITLMFNLLGYWMRRRFQERY